MVENYQKVNNFSTFYEKMINLSCFNYVETGKKNRKKTQNYVESDCIVGQKESKLSKDLKNHEKSLTKS